MTRSKLETQNLAKAYAKKGDPNGWFEEFYARAEGEISNIYWADLKPNPLLIEWLKSHPGNKAGKAIIVGCGLGDDAEAMSLLGFEVTAFDISPSAISMCKNRYPESKVNYVVADLFDLPEVWHQGFDFVYECNTIQILTGEARNQALEAIAQVVGQGGELVVSCRSRESGEDLDAFPLALDRDEIDGFERAGLIEIHFLAYDDDQSPPVPHFFAVYQRPKS